jgi:hypothetical protein
VAMVLIRTLGGFCRVFWKRKESSAISMRIVNREECAIPLTIGKDQFQLQHTTLPQSVLLARDGALPALEVQGRLRGALRLCDKPERVVTPPLLPI